MYKFGQERNYDGVQHAEHRKRIEKPFNDMHDELSDCYYNKKPFRDYGLLDKQTFDELHGLIFEKLLVHFHEENVKNPEGKRIPEAEYRFYSDADGKQIDKIAEAQAKIDNRSKKGLTLNIEH